MYSSASSVKGGNPIPLYDALKSLEGTATITPRGEGIEQVSMVFNDLDVSATISPDRGENREPGSRISDYLYGYRTCKRVIASVLVKNLPKGVYLPGSYTRKQLREGINIRIWESYDRLNTLFLALIESAKNPVTNSDSDESSSGTDLSDGW